MSWYISYGEEVTVSMLPHLRKFILKFHHQDEPVKVDFNTSLGVAFNSVLRKKERYRKDRERYTSPMRFRLSQDLSDLSLSPAYLVQINVEYDRFFKEQLYNWVMAQGDVGINNSQSIRNFLKHYKISETDLSFDTARTMFNRYKTDYFRKKRQSSS